MEPKYTAPICPVCGKPALIANNGDRACLDPTCVYAHGIPKVAVPWLEDLERS